MKGDFSRIRFNPAKNYTAVMQQQGRVSLDADANEQTAIDAYLRDTTNVDVIGKYGGPSDDCGFAIEVKAGKILIGRGRYYVDGILVENDRVVDYADQPFLIPPTGTGAEQISEADLIAALAAGNTVQFVLEVWRRFITELDDPCLVEPAIGQADTTGRLQTIWRVIGAIGDTVGTKPAAASEVKADATASTEVNTKAAASNPTSGDVVVIVGAPRERSKCQNPILGLSSCCQLLYKRLPYQHTGKMSAQTTPGGDCGCQPIPAAGYQGLENQLYRVEIHTGGPFATATFKWSRENASVVAKVTAINGAIVTANTLGPDANLGFQVGNWVELSDDTNLFGDPPNQPGILYQIQALGPNPLQVTLASAVTGVDTTKNARMRRWDQTGASAVIGGIPLSSTPLQLENGIEVAFSQDGNFVSGDYWTIPARTADGQIDWACGETGDPFLPPHYFAIYGAPLACVQQASNTFTNNPPTNIPTTNVPPTGAKPAANDTSRIFVPPPSPYIIDDCRLKFPPLTAVTCGDQGPCTIIPRPGPGWEAPLLALKPGANADICFPIGDFPVTKTVVLEGLGNLRLTGGGFGTQILATGVTAALLFDNCLSVQISDLFASTCTVRIRNQRNTTPPLGGLLSFADCVEVSIDSVALKCGYAEERTASCINVQNTYAPQATTKNQTGARLSAFEERGGIPVPATGWGEVRIRHCNLEVGGNQEGILLVRVARAQIEDNTLVAWRPRTFTFRQRLQNPRFRASALNQLISSAQYVKVANQDLKQGEAAAHPAPAQESNAPADAQPGEAHNAEAGTSQPTEAPKAAPENPQGAEAAKTATDTQVGDLPIKVVRPNATVNIGGQTVQFQTHPLLKDFWQRYLETQTNVPKLFATSRDLLLYVKKTALSFLTNPKQYQDNSAMTAVIAGLDQADQVVIGRAISVGGEGIQECRILNNSIHNAVEGITVGMSNHKQNPFTNEIAGTVTISGNQIYVGLPPRSISRAHAIFVGNVNSLMIENNYAEVLASPNANSTFNSYFERLSFLIAIQVWGVFGRRIIVRHCHVAGFEIGILLDAVESPLVDKTPLWLVADNMAEDTFRVAVARGLAQTTNVTNMWINNLS